MNNFFIIKKSVKKLDNLAEMYSYCDETNCGEVAVCEGKKISVVGYIDQSNLTAEKFFLNDSSNPSSLKANLEVRFSGDTNTNQDIFNKFNALAKNQNNPVTVSGIISGFDMPIMGTCKRGFNLNLSDESAID